MGVWSCRMIIDNECDDNLKALFDLGVGPPLRKGFTFATYKQGIKKIETWINISLRCFVMAVGRSKRAS